MKLVKFKNGKYGVRIGNWLMGYKFLSSCGYGFSSTENINKHCQFKTIEEVKSIAKGYELKYVVLKEDLK